MIRLRVVPIGILMLSSVALVDQAMGQVPAAPDLHLRGDRFTPLTYDKLTAEQRALVDDVLSGERGTLDGPFNVTLRSPVMGDKAQKLGAELRFHSSLPKKLVEMAILMTARFWTAQYEWSGHRKLALAAGLSPAVIEAIAAGRRPAAMQPDEEVVYNFADELFRTRQVSDPVFRAAVNKFGERGAVDLTGIMGYYCFVSMMLNVDRYPLPEGDKPELKPLLP
jgi:4-carboxymuconolactone decarboxylase